MAEFHPRILVVEDNPDDALILEHALQRAGLDAPVHICRDGLEAIDYLKGKGKYRDRQTYPFPRMMISDLKMPRCSGLELLEWVQSHPRCSALPVLILSTSAQEKDVTAAYRLGANTYFQKPMEMNRLVRLLKEAMSYWSNATLPNSPDHCD